MKIQIRGPIVDDSTGMMYDYFQMPNVTPSKIAEALKSDDGDVSLDIASNGGDVFAASEIYTMLRSSEKQVNVNIVGLAASAASVIAMAGDNISISPTAHIMIHKAWTNSQGNADNLAHESDVLKGIDESIATAYATKTGLDRDTIIDLMGKETWLNAKDAVDKGFADEIMFEDADSPAVFNSLEIIPNKIAVNKLLNFIQREKQVDNPENTLKKKKLVILLGKDGIN